MSGPPILSQYQYPHPWTFQKEFSAHLCHIRVCCEASKGQLILITVVQEMQQLQCPIEVPGPETDSGLEICGMLFLLPLSPQTSSVQLLGWLWRPQHIAPTSTLHTSVRRDLTSFDYSWTAPHLWSPSSPWFGLAAAEGGTGQAELAQPSSLSPLKTWMNKTRAINP